MDAETVGLENALRVIQAHPETDRVGIRVDSGDIAEQCVLYFERMRKAGIPPRRIVFEDEVTPGTWSTRFTTTSAARRGRSRPCSSPAPAVTGGGWSTATRWRPPSSARPPREHPNVKFSNSPGKESLGGYLRVHARGDTLVVADASEKIDGEPLFVKLVEQGRIVYRETFDEQADRADRTWGHYKHFTLSEKVRDWQQCFRDMREREVTAARQRLAAE